MIGRSPLWLTGCPVALSRAHTAAPAWGEKRRRPARPELSDKMCAVRRGVVAGRDHAHSTPFARTKMRRIWRGRSSPLGSRSSRCGSQPRWTRLSTAAPNRLSFPPRRPHSRTQRVAASATATTDGVARTAPCHRKPLAISHRRSTVPFDHPSCFCCSRRGACVRGARDAMRQCGHHHHWFSMGKGAGDRVARWPSQC